MNLFEVERHVSLAIRGGYVPEKFGSREYQNHLFRPYLKLCFFSRNSRFPLFSGPRIVKTAKLQNRE